MERHSYIHTQFSCRWKIHIKLMVFFAVQEKNVCMEDEEEEAEKSNWKCSL